MKELCGMCHGTGEGIANVNPNDLDSSEYVDCFACRGTGRKQAAVRERVRDGGLAMQKAVEAVTSAFEKRNLIRGK